MILNILPSSIVLNNFYQSLALSAAIFSCKVEPMKAKAALIRTDEA
jgi:hypothetical protein